MQVEWNPQARPFVPPVMAPTPAYHQGEQEEVEELVGSKHDIRSGRGGWAGWRYVERLNLCYEPKFEDKYWDRESGTIRKVMKKKRGWRANGGDEAEQNGTTCHRAQRENEVLRTDRR